MKHVVYLIGFLLLNSFNGSTQVVHLSTLESEARCVLGESNNVFSVKDFTLAEGSETRYLKAVEVVNGNMVFRFSLPKLFPQEYYKLEWTITAGAREFRIAPEMLSQHIIRTNAKASVSEVVWYRPFDQVPFEMDEFHLILRAHFYGEPCPFADDVVPSFEWKQQRFYLGSALAGGALIGLSEVVFVNQARKDYDDYEALVTTEPLSILSPQEIAEADQLLASVKDNESSARLMRRTGQVIIAGTVVLYTLRYLKFKKDYKKWQRYCEGVSPAIGLSPMYDTSTPTPSLGMAFTLTF